MSAERERHYDSSPDPTRSGHRSLTPQEQCPSSTSGIAERNRGGRVYVGNLPNHVDRQFVEDLFNKFGRIIEISIKRTISGTPFAFVEYADSLDAQDAIQDRDGYKIDGNVLRVELPFASRGASRVPTREGPSHRGGQGPSRRREFRVTVRGLPASGSWQDLKDHMREAGDCVYADVFRDGTGVVEFGRYEDMDYALRHLQDIQFVSHEGETSYITLTRGGADRRRHFRRGGRGTSPGYNNRQHYSRECRSGSSHRRRSPRRSRSRSHGK